MKSCRNQGQGMVNFQSSSPTRSVPSDKMVTCQSRELDAAASVHCIAHRCSILSNYDSTYAAAYMQYMFVELKSKVRGFLMSKI